MEAQAMELGNDTGRTMVLSGIFIDLKTYGTPDNTNDY